MSRGRRRGRQVGEELAQLADLAAAGGADEERGEGRIHGGCERTTRASRRHSRNDVMPPAIRACILRPRHAGTRRRRLGAFIERVALPPGWRVLHEPSVESTNDLAREAARRGWPDRSVFVADYQTKGRGRHGRTWLCPPRAGLLMSVLLAPSTRPPRPTRCWRPSRSARRSSGCRARAAIKWPNDVVLDGQKAAGVLAEATDDGREQTVIVGVGVNVNLEPEELADLPNATSLSIEAACRPPRGAAGPDAGASRLLAQR